MEIEKYSPKWLLEKINNSKNDAHKLMHIIEYSKEIIKSTDQQLILSGVSQQRELLNFLKWYDLDVEYNSKQTHKQLILSYEQKFNCG